MSATRRRTLRSSGAAEGLAACGHPLSYSRTPASQDRDIACELCFSNREILVKRLLEPFEAAFAAAAEEKAVLRKGDQEEEQVVVVRSRSEEPRKASIPKVATPQAGNSRINKNPQQHQQQSILTFFGPKAQKKDNSETGDVIILGLSPGARRRSRVAIPVKQARSNSVPAMEKRDEQQQRRPSRTGGRQRKEVTYYEGSSDEDGDAEMQCAD